MKVDVFRRGRASDWTLERIEQLSVEDIKQLRENATRLREDAVVELCSRALGSAAPSGRSRAGGKSMAHRHAGSVLAYVLEGAIRSGINDEEPKVYKAGESFFEPPGSTHSVSENASETEPARLLAIIVAPEDEKLTVPAN